MANAKSGEAASLPRDPLNVRMRQLPWGQLTDLTPVPVAMAQARAKIEAMLLEAGYVRGQPDRQMTVEQAKRIGAAEVYFRSEARLPCGNSFIVFVTFDDQNRLIRAEGITHEAGCL